MWQVKLHGIIEGLVNVSIDPDPRVAQKRRSAVPGTCCIAAWQNQIAVGVAQPGRIPMQATSHMQVELVLCQTINFGLCSSAAGRLPTVRTGR